MSKSSLALGAGSELTLAPPCVDGSLPTLSFFNPFFPLHDYFHYLREHVRHKRTY